MLTGQGLLSFFCEGLVGKYPSVCLGRTVAFRLLSSASVVCKQLHIWANRCGFVPPMSWLQKWAAGWRLPSPALEPSVISVGARVEVHKNRMLERKFPLKGHGKD